jgi:hypothetical protein
MTPKAAKTRGRPENENPAPARSWSALSDGAMPVAPDQTINIKAAG